MLEDKGESSEAGEEPIEVGKTYRSDPALHTCCMDVTSHTARLSHEVQPHVVQLSQHMSYSLAAAAAAAQQNQH